MVMSMKPNDLHSFLTCAPRLPKAGWIADGSLRKVPEQPLHLYEFESCPYCRKAREAFANLDIDYISHPSGKGSNNRQFVVEHGGKAMFPYLFDPNTGVKMHESEDIITYIRDTYGSGRATWRKAIAPLNTLGSAIASGMRPFGGKALPAAAERTQPEQLLVLWQFEMSPFCRKVREALCELNLNYHSRNVARDGRQREDLIALGGKMQVPYFIDPNTDTAMYESDAIVAYLHRTYG